VTPGKTDNETIEAAAAAPPDATGGAPRDLDTLTPAMRQYWEQKQQAGEAILLFRMGDFYEMFHDDAMLAARVLGITLTSRDKGRTPLAGIPYHALDGYLAKLVAAGHKVAISEQVEDARLAKGVVKRAIVRIVTPGTLTDDGLLDQSRPNILAAVCVGADGPTAGRAKRTADPPVPPDGKVQRAPQGAECGIATLELSTGELVVQMCPEPRLLDELARIGPAEVLLAEWSGVGRHPLESSIKEQTGAAVTSRPAADYGPHRAEQLLTEQFEVRGLVGFGFEKIDASLQAAGALLAYARETQVGATRHLRPPRRQSTSDHLVLDQTTLRSLEIERTMRIGGRAGSLLAAVDETCNAMGARLLRHWLSYPLRGVDRIRRRQRLLGLLRGEDGHRDAVRTALRQMGDIERMVGRLGVQRTTPRELRLLGDSLHQLRGVRESLRALRSDEADALADALEGLDELAARLTATLRAEAPIAMREGGIIAPGHDAELDRLRTIGRDGQTWLAEYQRQEIERTGIPTLKVGFNKVFGYYIEVTNPHRDRVPDGYVRKQTLKNAERFITDELKRYETEVLSADARANDLEYDMFIELRDEVAGHIPRLQQAGAALATADVIAGWAELSIQRRWCAPEFVDERVLEIDEGRHPVLDAAMGSSFVPNDCRLAAREQATENGEKGTKAPRPEGTQEGGNTAPEPSTRNPEPSACALALITGPNMAGKSTYIRQVALLTLLAHCGCWAPARRMRLGAVDRIFTRVGASDELARGQSTFMVEMLETANILHNATADSLVILDEIGRGTSTFDGLSLAWAITEQLGGHIGCRALFATHYHELTELSELVDGVANLNVEVREYEDRIVFLHRIVPGAADRSYGLHVAKLAGIAPGVIERANAVLNELEQTFGRESKRPALAAVQRRRQRQLRLFEEPEETVVRELRELSEDGLTGELALLRMRKWRKLLGLDAPNL
jgi:DNA mismatch repair protein MutS